MRGPSNNGSICSSVCCQGASRTRSQPGRPARGGGQAGAGAESRHTPSWTGPRLQSSPRLESCFRATCPQSRLEARAVWVQRIPGQGTEQLRVKTCSVEVGCGLGTGGGSPSPLRWCGTGGDRALRQAAAPRSSPASRGPSVQPGGSSADAPGVRHVAAPCPPTGGGGTARWASEPVDVSGTRCTCDPSRKGQCPRPARARAGPCLA